ncbi:MAG: hypothetical protein WCG87_03920 [Bacteroidota bacterium]
MAAYLFQIELPLFTEEMTQLIPVHRSHINKLFSEGRLLSYSVSLQRNLIWCVTNAEDEQEAMEIIAGFPLHSCFVDVLSYPLLFHNTLPTALPGISLN